MNPSVELRLRTMIRAVTENILPAIDPDDSLAQEQGRLLLGHLHALLQQHGHEEALRSRQRRLLDRLARDLLEAGSGGPVTLAARAALGAALADSDEALSIAVERFVLATGSDGDAGLREQTAGLVLAHAAEEVRAGEVWFRAMGFATGIEAPASVAALLEEER
ncbi:MAG: hypothetical protein HY749_07915 [Gammaproteobacteria bacterium]|nr:hypothetical protein [Gammaproteobacteria bacterium]